MEAFRKLEALAATLDRADVDTDQIIPKQFLKKIERTGFGQHLFHDWRFLDDAGTKPNPDFALNQERFSGAQILLARDNFGCGSSREHAPWALLDYGFRSIIAPSFADIFYNNCFKNGILPIALPKEQVDLLMKDAEKGANARVTIDLESQTITTSDGQVITFEVDSFKKHCLLNGLDDIGLTMEKAAAIDSFEAKATQARPWV